MQPTWVCRVKEQQQSCNILTHNYFKQYQSWIPKFCLEKLGSFTFRGELTSVVQIEAAIVYLNPSFLVANPKENIDGLDHFIYLFLMAYQPSWFISCQIHPYRKTVVVLFNPQLGDKSVYTFLKVNWLFCLTAYQPFSGHLMPNQIILIKVLVWFNFMAYQLL